MTIQEMYDMFLLEQEFRNNSPVTISWYKDQLEEFFIWLMDNIPKAYNDPAQLNLLNLSIYQSLWSAAGECSKTHTRVRNFVVNSPG